MALRAEQWDERILATLAAMKCSISASHPGLVGRLPDCPGQPDVAKSWATKKDFAATLRSPRKELYGGFHKWGYPQMDDL